MPVRVEPALAPDEAWACVRRAGQGDREAFLQLTRAYQKKVFVLAYGFFRDKEDALDMVQETFLRLFQKLDSFEDGRNFEAWLMQIARHLCIDAYRKRRARHPEAEVAVPVEELPIPDRRDEGRERMADIKDILDRCVNRLAERQRLIFVMRHYNQLRNEEIADMMNISLGTVKSLHFKAIQNLRALMAPYMGCRT